MATTAKVLCAVYTRKSTEEGLDQDFNSLDAQHEACANYIASQKSESWMMLKDRYDDGGFSGGTLERPAVKRLLDDVRHGWSTPSWSTRSIGYHGRWPISSNWSSYSISTR